MTSPEQTNISQAAEQMTFAADFNRNLDDQEKREAAEKLDDLVGSTLEKFPRHVKSWTNINPEKIQDLSLLLSVPQEDGSSITVSVRSEFSVDNTRFREISVQEIRNDRGGEYHRYYIEDGQALRFDKDFSKPDDLGLPMELSVEAIKRSIDICKNQLENDRLEKEMGINRQPVGIDEIDKLAELLESAVPDTH